MRDRPLYLLGKNHFTYIVSFHLFSLDNTSLHFSTLLQRKSTLVSSIVSGSKAGQRSTQKSTADQQRPIRHPTVHASDPAYRSTTTLLALKLAMKISSPSTWIAETSPCRSTRALCKMSPDWMSMTWSTLPGSSSSSTTKALPCETATAWGL